MNVLKPGSIPFSYEKTNHDFRVLVEKIQQSGKAYEGIIAIANGGLAPAYYLAKALDLPIECINVASYKGHHSGAVIERDICNKGDIFQNKNFLWVDDIYDTGNTIEYLRKKYPNMDMVTPYVRWKKDADRVDYFAEILEHDQWVEFPWERDFY